MSWLKFRDLFLKRKIDESHFVLGIDLGNSTSAIAYFDANRGAPEIIDISGGYGKPSAPTAMQYVSETKEWIFGEYALLNRGEGKEVTILSLLERLAKSEYIEIDGKPESVTYVLGIYLKELIGNCKNLNPKAEIAGIVFSIPSYVSDEVRKSFMAAFEAAGYDKAVIGFDMDRECIFEYYYYDKTPVKENILLLDFGSRELRGGIYEAEPTESGAKIVNVSSLFDINLGTQKINDEVNNLFKYFYCQEIRISADKISPQVNEQISTFTYQHKDLLFQKNEKAKPVKLYFNFAYPPFQKTVTKQDADNFIRPFKNRMAGFLKEVFTKTLLPEERVSADNIDTILCTGGGFEMFWARQLVAETFPKSNVVFYKNSKGILAEGACIKAAGKLRIIPEKKFEMTDLHRLQADIGVKVISGGSERFISLMDRNSFWWQHRDPVLFIINEPVTDRPVKIEIVKRNASGETKKIGCAEIKGLPPRPAGTTRIRMAFSFSSYNLFNLAVTDLGFGELFRKTDYTQQFSFVLD